MLFCPARTKNKVFVFMYMVELQQTLPQVVSI